MRTHRKTHAHSGIPGLRLNRERLPNGSKCVEPPAPPLPATYLVFLPVFTSIACREREKVQFISVLQPDPAAGRVEVPLPRRYYTALEPGGSRVFVGEQDPPPPKWKEQERGRARALRSAWKRYGLQPWIVAILADAADLKWDALE